MNKVTLMGRFTKDPELRYASTTNNAFLNFTLAVDRRYTKEGEEKQADFISCKAFGRTAELMGKFMTKGRQVAVSGRIQTGSYEKEGQKIYTTDVIVDEFFFADSKGGENQTRTFEGNSSEAGAPGFFPVDNGEDELPF